LTSDERFRPRRWLHVSTANDIARFALLPLSADLHRALHARPISR
jgi:hypothetical protein